VQAGVANFCFRIAFWCDNKGHVKPHILFVDDEAPIRELLALYFRKRGYDVTTAVTSKEALTLASTSSFHLAILDVDIAGENGLELLTTFKAQYVKMPVIMFTGLASDTELLAKSKSLGADGFMQKQGSLHELFGEVQRFVPVPPA
jgi:two-component system, OmpR family, response regulator